MDASAVCSAGSHKKPTQAIAGLPGFLRALFVADRPRTGGWLVQRLLDDTTSEIMVDEAVGCAAGLDRLREETYDVLLVSHLPGTVDATEVIRGYRAGGANEPIVVLGMQSEQEAAIACLQTGADAYLCVNTTTTELLLWTIARAVERHRLTVDYRRLELAEQQRLAREHDEANHLLAQQRALIHDLELLQAGPHSSGDLDEGVLDESAEDADGSGTRKLLDELPEPNKTHDQTPSPAFPEALIAHYRQLLRAYVIMGSGNLTRELNRFAEILVSTGVTARQAMQLHVHALEELVHGLGSRSTRHVMTRADLLVLEIMTHLAEGYRQCYRRRQSPPVQRFLPGFDDLATEQRAS